MDHGPSNDCLSGGCLCGDIRYRIDAVPVEALYCHCQICRRAHGAPVVAWLNVSLAGFAVTAGSPAVYRSSPAVSRQFCGRCGTPLTWQSLDNPLSIDVSIATLDDPATIGPSLHIWTESRIAWFETADQLPRCPTNRRPNPAR